MLSVKIGNDAYGYEILNMKGGVLIFINWSAAVCTRFNQKSVVLELGKKMTLGSEISGLENS